MYQAMGRACREAARAATEDARTMLACNRNPLPRFDGSILKLEDGASDMWHLLVAWKCSTKGGLEGQVFMICRFIEAWAAALYMRGISTLEECMDNGKVCTVGKTWVDLHGSIWSLLGSFFGYEMDDSRWDCRTVGVYRVSEIGH